MTHDVPGTVNATRANETSPALVAAERDALIAHHDEEARIYLRAAARLGGDLGANARSYAAHHSAQARALREAATTTDGAGDDSPDAPRMRA